MTMSLSDSESFSKPLDGLTVLDLSQFLAGPYASLRLQDLGARVIKVERSDGGDICRNLYLSDTEIDGDSTLFHAINRGKESLSLNLKADSDREILIKLIKQSDVFIQNFRPNVIDRLGFSYEQVSTINPSIIYGSVNGYGNIKKWAHLPGQDLLAQAKSGIMWLSGKADDGPVPVGLPVADILAGSNLTQGILAALVRRGINNKGALVETSLFESLIDLQFEFLATWLNDGERKAQRSKQNSAHAGLAAPYGIYETSDGYLAIAMVSLNKLSELLKTDDFSELLNEVKGDFKNRDEIKDIIAQQIVTESTNHWLSILEAEDIWCSEILNWSELSQQETADDLDMFQTVDCSDGSMMRLTKSPIRINGKRIQCSDAAPKLGSNNQTILNEFGISY